MALTLPDDALAAPPQRGALADYVRRNPTIVAGGALLGLMALLAVIAPWIASDPITFAPANRLRGPSAEFWLGTDELGRDVFSRSVYGARVSLIVGFTVALLACVVGLVVGLVSGFIRLLDAVVMRIMDGLMAIPAILLAIAFVAITRSSIWTVIVAVTIPEVPRVVRLVRSVAARRDRQHAL